MAHVEIFTLDEKTNIKGINWSSLGTVSTKEAKEFVKELTTKIEEVEKLNSKEIKK